MKGRAHQLVTEFSRTLSGARRSFVMARFILISRVDPEKVSPDADDPELERRIEEAIAKLQSFRDKP